MSLLHKSVAIALVGLIQACSSSPQQIEQITGSSNLVQLSEVETPLAPTFIMRGTAILGHETQSFVACGSNQQYWLEVDPNLLNQATNLTSDPYQPIYAEFIGHLEKTSIAGFDSDFAARFIVSGINVLTVENVERCDQPYRSTKAFGNEPFWSIEFSDEKTRYQQLGVDERGLSLSSTRLNPTERTYHFDQGQLTITKELCTDSMSDSLYGWTSSLENNDTTKNGCATLANQDATLKWANTYVATSTYTSGFDVELQLNPDHTATTTYSYATGLPTTESGFWQELNTDQVQVVMTHHQGQRLVAERLFTLKGNQLIAEYEKVTGKVYPIANGGLVLYKNTP
ncbi:hypothetical protein R3X26_16805 [Vibrio sp. TH_r3]|uniref:COG3650 family protein n=1 Tax=Vibrio sp. TH_r3 TaxID=3082084 RepID=UPI002954A974|nr:hypothetical protein [Vibrio sp. TH_r3]MDV7106063.1 hypothetical protein [Vibrio sp. TH_r3]